MQKFYPGDKVKVISTGGGQPKEYLGEICTIKGQDNILHDTYFVKENDWCWSFERLELVEKSSNTKDKFEKQHREKLMDKLLDTYFAEYCEIVNAEYDEFIKAPELYVAFATCGNNEGRYMVDILLVSSNKQKCYDALLNHEFQLPKNQKGILETWRNNLQIDTEYIRV